MSDTPPPPQAPDSAPTLPGTPVTPTVPKHMGRYAVRKLLGRGGMGQVYLAQDTELDRSVALKVISPDLAGSEMTLERFRREARAVARLNHPGIVQIYEFSQHEGLPFFAMEYVDGRSLTEVLARGKLTPDQALRLALNAVNALDYALEENIIHRDIKPANILISKRGILKLLDFGLARCIEQDSDLTQTGTVVGSPHYMSPEQGKGEHVDHRSDIYSLGVTLYHMVTGARPFDADSPLAIMMQHVQTPLPRPEALQLLLGGRLLALIERMTAKDPTDRFQTYDDLREEIRALLALAQGDSGLVAEELDASRTLAPALPGVTVPDSPQPEFSPTPSQPVALTPGSGPSATVQSMPSRHPWLIAIVGGVVAAALVIAVVLFFAKGMLQRARRNAAPRPVMAEEIAPAQLATPTPTPQVEQAPAVVADTPSPTPTEAPANRFAFLEKIEPNLPEILGERELSVATKILDLEFSEAVAEIQSIRTVAEGEETDAAREDVERLGKLADLVGELAEIKQEIIWYVTSQPRPVALQISRRDRKVKVFVSSATDEAVTVTLSPEGPSTVRSWALMEKSIVMQLALRAIGGGDAEEVDRRMELLRLVLERGEPRDVSLGDSPLLGKRRQFPLRRARDKQPFRRPTQR